MISLLNFLIHFRFQILLDLHALHLQQKILFLFQFFQLFPNIGIHKICYILTVKYLWHHIIFPLLGDHVVFLQWNAEDSSAALLFLNLSDGLLFLYFLTKIDLDWWSLDIVPLFWLRHVHSVDVVLLCLDYFWLRLWQLNVEYQFARHLSSRWNVFKF